jgi:hypothetical protein
MVPVDRQAGPGPAEIDAMAFLVRWVHVAAVSFLFGGALLLFLLFLVLRKRDADRRTLLQLMQTYEWASWGAIGLVVMTGVGNLGHFGESLPERESEWGREFSLKLGLAGVFLAFSVVRSFGVALTQLRLDTASRLPPALLGMYGTTAVLVASIVGVAVALAHF